jgi:hypothetical protein
MIGQLIFKRFRQHLRALLEQKNLHNVMILLGELFLLDLKMNCFSQVYNRHFKMPIWKRISTHFLRQTIFINLRFF